VTIGTANGLSLSTQALSLGLASTSATGALSSTDWNTFNLKQAALSGTGFVKISGSTISYDNSTYALDSAVVHNTGNETIGGEKSFTSFITNTVSAGNNIVLNKSSGPSIQFNKTAATSQGWSLSGEETSFKLYNTTKSTTPFYVGTNDNSTFLGTITASNFSGSSSGTNTGDQTLASLGAQPQLNGTGFVKASGTTISYDNSTYLTGNQTITLSGDVSGSGAATLTGLTPASGTVIKVGNIVASNVTASAVTVTLGISNNPTYASGTAYYIAYQISVPPNASVILVDKTTAFYVTQFQSVGAIASTGAAIHFTAAVESITSP
jgi:hypothetical protein